MVIRQMIKTPTGQNTVFFVLAHNGQAKNSLTLKSSKILFYAL